MNDFTRTATILVRANDDHSSDWSLWEQEMTCPGA